VKPATADKIIRALFGQTEEASGHHTPIAGDSKP